MKCFRCSETIMEKGKYFIMVEMDNEKEVRRDYVHKTCWNKFLHQVGSVEESMSIIKGLKKWFIKQGVLPAEEYKVC